MRTKEELVRLMNAAIVDLGAANLPGDKAVSASVGAWLLLITEMLIDIRDTLNRFQPHYHGSKPDEHQG